MTGGGDGRARGWRALVARTAGTVTVVATIPLVAIGVAAWTGLLPRLPEVLRAVISVAALPLLAVWVLGAVGSRLTRPDPPPPVPLRSPVVGRWRAMNGPATRVPSHGTHLLGQTYAIDLVHEPQPGARPRFGGGHPVRAIDAYPAFGQPAFSPVAGRVVATRHSARDHRARSNLLGVAFMFVESAILSLRGPAGILGNHVVIEVEDGGRWVTLAHLRRGSVTVRPGDRVAAGQPVGQVGNSGNSSEPHVHLQVTDDPRPWLGLGVPFVFTDVIISDALELPAVDETEPLVPCNDAIFHGLGSVGLRAQR